LQFDQTKKALKVRLSGLCPVQVTGTRQMSNFLEDAKSILSVKALSPIK